MVEEFKKSKIVPVAVFNEPEEALGSAKALQEAGFNTLEITLRTDNALECLKVVREAYPDLWLGAGTILNAADLWRVKEMGVDFGVTPGVNPGVLEENKSVQLPLVPGVVTPGEVEQARNYGYTLLKFFPAEAAGGVKMLKALAGPYRHIGVQFLPTGGIDGSNVRSYLALPEVVAVGGSWIVSGDFVKNREFGKMTEFAKEARASLEDT